MTMLQVLWIRGLILLGLVTVALVGTGIVGWRMSIEKPTMKIPGPQEEFTFSMGKRRAICAVAFSPDGKLLVGGGDSVRVWDLATATTIADLNGGGQAHEIVFTPDGSTLISGSFDRTIRLWDTRNWALLDTLEGHKGCVSSLAISPDGLTLASGEVKSGATIRLWDIARRKQKHVMRGTDDDQTVTSLAFSADGSMLLSGCYRASKLWNVVTGQKVATLDGESASGVGFCPGRSVFATAYADVTLWDACSLQKLDVFGQYLNHVEAICFSPNGQILASVGGGDRVHEPGELKLWDVGTAKLIASHRIHSGHVHCVAISSDGELLATGSLDGAVKVWRLKSLLRNKGVGSH